jgi:hypothetical protein
MKTQNGIMLLAKPKIVGIGIIFFSCEVMQLNQNDNQVEFQKMDSFSKPKKKNDSNKKILYDFYHSEKVYDLVTTKFLLFLSKRALTILT